MKEERKREPTWVSVHVYRCKKRGKKEEKKQFGERFRKNSDSNVRKKMCIYSGKGDLACV